MARRLIRFLLSGESQFGAPASSGAVPCGPKAELVFVILPKDTQNPPGRQLKNLKIVQPRSSLATSSAGLASLEVGPVPSDSSATGLEQHGLCLYDLIIFSALGQSQGHFLPQTSKSTDFLVLLLKAVPLD